MASTLLDRFMRYVRCGSESHNEKAFCELIEHELHQLSIPYERQELGPEVVTNGWNILAKTKGKPHLKPLLLVFHMDTVAPGNNIEPYVENGILQSRGSTILGADGKLAIALVLHSIEKQMESGMRGRPLELLFTVCQEMGLQGSKYADYSKIDSEEAVVIDHYVTGEILARTPSVIQMNVELIGREAHVIVDAASGINALQSAAEIVSRLPLGRVNDNLNVNVSNFVSISRTNIIPKYARFDLEIRSFGNEQFERTIADVKRIIYGIAKQSHCECKVNENIMVHETFFDENTDMIERMKHVYDLAGIEMKIAKSFGYLDASCTNNLGIRTIPVGISIHNTHSARECVYLEDLGVMERLTDAIITAF